MEKSPERSPELLIKSLSKPNGRKVAKAAGPLLSSANSKVDHALTQRSLKLMGPIIRTLKTALPGTDPELIGGFFANLLDLWETGQKLDKELQKLKKLRLPRDRETLRNTLLWIDAIQVDMASYWIEEVNKDLPKLLRAIDRGMEPRSSLAKRKRQPPKARSGRRPGGPAKRS